MLVPVSSRVKLVLLFTWVFRWNKELVKAVNSRFISYCNHWLWYTYDVIDYWKILWFMFHLQLFTSKILYSSYFFLLIFSLRFEFLFLLFFQFQWNRLVPRISYSHISIMDHQQQVLLVNRLDCLVPGHSGTK